MRVKFNKSNYQQPIGKKSMYWIITSLLIGTLLLVSGIIIHHKWVKKYGYYKEDIVSTNNIHIDTVYVNYVPLYKISIKAVNITEEKGYLILTYYIVRPKVKAIDTRQIIK